METAINTESSAASGTPTLHPRKRGPKTELGKRRVSRNAIKHGVFVNGLMSGESEEEYNEMKARLCESFQPLTEAKKVLVHRLVAYLRRHQRLMNVETAEIVREQEDTPPKPSLELRGVLLASKKPMIEKCGLFAVADSEIDFAILAYELDNIRRAIEKSGPNWKRDRPILLEIYSHVIPEGEFRLLGPAPKSEEPRGPIADTYRKYMAENKLDSEECRDTLIGQLYLEMDRVNKPWDEKRAARHRREELRQIIAQVPQGDAANRLGLYEVRLNREINLVLRHLERLQG